MHSLHDITSDSSYDITSDNNDDPTEDQLLILNGDERMDYFDEKPEFSRKKNIVELILNSCEIW